MVAKWPGTRLGRSGPQLEGRDSLLDIIQCALFLIFGICPGHKGKSFGRWRQQRDRHCCIPPPSSMSGMKLLSTQT